MTEPRTYKNIIIGTDGSESADLAFMEAIGIAKRNQANVYVVQVINNVANYLPEDAVLELKNEAEEIYSRLSEIAANQGFNDLFSVIVEGSPKKMLAVTLPEDLDADLIVIGATGKHVLSESLMGSIAHYASSNAKCSVLIVRA